MEIGEVAPLAPDLGFAPIFLFIVHCGVFQKYSDSFTQRKARGRVGCPNDLLSSSAAENLYMWGGNAQGECGIGNTANQHRPGSRTLQLLGGPNPPQGGFVTDWFCRTPKNGALKKPAVTPIAGKCMSHVFGKVTASVLVRILGFHMSEHPGPKIMAPSYQKPVFCKWRG